MVCTILIVARAGVWAPGCGKLSERTRFSNCSESRVPMQFLDDYYSPELLRFINASDDDVKLGRVDLEL